MLATVLSVAIRRSVQMPNTKGENWVHFGNKLTLGAHGEAVDSEARSELLSNLVQAACRRRILR